MKFSKYLGFKIKFKIHLRKHIIPFTYYQVESKLLYSKGAIQLGKIIAIVKSKSVLFIFLNHMNLKK